MYCNLRYQVLVSITEVKVSVNLVEVNYKKVDNNNNSEKEKKYE